MIGLLIASDNAETNFFAQSYGRKLATIAKVRGFLTINHGALVDDCATLHEVLQSPITLLLYT